MYRLSTKLYMNNAENNNKRGMRSRDRGIGDHCKNAGLLSLTRTTKEKQLFLLSFFFCFVVVVVVVIVFVVVVIVVVVVAVGLLRVTGCCSIGTDKGPGQFFFFFFTSRPGRPRPLSSMVS